MTLASAKPADPEQAPLIPRYGENTLPDLGCSLLAALGVAGEPNPLALPAAPRICLLLIDGMGLEQLRTEPDAAPFLSGLASRALAAGFPSTTVTSLGSLGTGLPPGGHGMLGYQVRVPGRDFLLNGLRWDKSVSPRHWQPVPTLFERARAGGVRPVRVAVEKIRDSGLSAAAMRGADYRVADTAGALAAVAGVVATEAAPALVLAYHGDLDTTGHALGWQSLGWRFQLAQVDRLAEQLCSALPGDCALYVTADHGMVDVPADARTDYDALPELREGVALLGGEPRARHVYTRPGAEDEVLFAWREILGPRAWVRTRDQAIADGWFGPVDPRVRQRVGDVVVAARGVFGIVATKAEERESRLIGMHGSLTPAEQLVPLLSRSPIAAE